MSFLISPSSNGRLEQLSKMSRETRAGGWTSRSKEVTYHIHVGPNEKRSAALKVTTPFSLDHKSLIDISNSINQDGLTPKHISNNVSFLSFLSFLDCLTWFRCIRLLAKLRLSLTRPMDRTRGSACSIIVFGLISFDSLFHLDSCIPYSNSISSPSRSPRSWRLIENVYDIDCA